MLCQMTPYERTLQLFAGRILLAPGDVRICLEALHGILYDINLYLVVTSFNITAKQAGLMTVDSLNTS
jgi:hypothetical protein